MKNIILLVMFTVIAFQLRAEEVSINVNGCNIKGSLEVPKSNDPVDVVLLISGSGPTDRDGNSPLLSGKNNSLKMLSDLFYKNGVASLWYDKRAIGASDKVKEADLTFDLYINDVIEWVKLSLFKSISELKMNA
jgi:uncharacterized protein